MIEVDRNSRGIAKENCCQCVHKSVCHLLKVITENNKIQIGNTTNYFLTWDSNIAVVCTQYKEKTNN